MNTYKITMMTWSNDDGSPTSDNRPRVIVLAEAEPGSNAIDALTAFATSRGVMEHYSPQGRKRLVGIGAPTIEADLVR